MRKFLVSAVVAASVVGGVALTSGTASAAPVTAQAYDEPSLPQPGGIQAEAVPAGVYPSEEACIDAGIAGDEQGRWYGFYCEPLTHGQYLLWVGPLY